MVVQRGSSTDLSIVEWTEGSVASTVVPGALLAYFHRSLPDRTVYTLVNSKAIPTVMSIAVTCGTTFQIFDLD